MHIKKEVNINATFAAHPDFRSHTDFEVTPIWNKNKRHHINNVFALSDKIFSVILAADSLKTQRYYFPAPIVYQANQLIMHVTNAREKMLREIFGRSPSFSI